MVKWVSRDKGESWHREVTLTLGSERNHTYARRPVDAHPDFYALWADGDPRELSPSALYFCDRSGKNICRFPPEMSSDFESPQKL